MQQVRDGLKTWDSKELWWSIMKTYNNEVQVRAQPNLAPLARLQIFEMCRNIDWCVCGNTSKDPCMCLIPQVPQESTRAETSQSMISNSVAQFSGSHGSGNSRKRSHNTLVIEGLSARVASIMYQLHSSKQISYEEDQENNTVYSAMLNDGLHVNVEMMCKLAENHLNGEVGVGQLLKSIETDKRLC